MSYPISDYIQSPINAVASDVNFLLFSRTASQIVQLLGVIDSIPEEEHILSAETSNYPIDSGAILSDHIFIKPTELSIVGYVSDILVSKITTLVTPFRDREAWQRITFEMQKREVVTIVTLLETYDNMVITNVQAIKNADNGGSGLRFKMSLKQTLIAETQTTKLPKTNVTGAAENRTGLVNGGNKQSQERDLSILGNLIELGRSLL